MDVPEILFEINIWNLLLSVIRLLVKGKGLGCLTSASLNIHSCCQCSLHGLLPSSQLSLSSRSPSPGCHPYPMSSLGLPSPSESQMSQHKPDMQKERLRYLNRDGQWCVWRGQWVPRSSRGSTCFMRRDFVGWGRRSLRLAHGFQSQLCHQPTVWP
uniref:Uncharacterized protein n=1 Tax=Myotis myotis TaxID=51298 RepID=A0A7J8AMI6_MYOMY|nr:hypothetical protein mMyoMyo1_007977 [Myotis myotis]